MRLLTSVAVALALPALTLAADIPKAGSLLLSKNSDGAVANAPSSDVAISSNGKRISFATLASNLGPGTFNGFRQVFQCKRNGTELGLASISALDGPANVDCGASKLSSNGRYIAFESESTMFVNGVIGGSTNVFRRDRETGDIVLASATSTGAQVVGNMWLRDMSPDGRFVLFETDAKNVVPGVSTGHSRVYVRDLELGTTTLVSQNDAEVPLTNLTVNARISANGRYVFFTSASPELDGYDQYRVYMRDLKKGTTTNLSRNSHGEVADAFTYLVAVSENGRFLLMRTYATNLTALKEGGIILLDRANGSFVAVDIAKPGLSIAVIDDQAIVANDGSRIWMQIYYTAKVGSAHQYDLIEVNRAKKKLWTRISLENYPSAPDEMSIDGSANAEWVAVATDEPITDSTGKIDLNGQRDVYLLRAH